MKINLFNKIVAGLATIFLADFFLTGVEFQISSSVTPAFITAKWQLLIYIGIILGLINSFIKPIIRFVTLPMKMFSFGLLSPLIELLLNLGIIIFLNYIFSEIYIIDLQSLILLTLINFIGDKLT